MAITHHVLVRLSAFRVGEAGFTQYLLLGDDLVINSKKVADSYQSLMKELGVQISIGKCLYPVSRANLYPTEFASKLTLNGVDVRPLPLGLVLEGRASSIFTFVKFAIQAHMRDVHEDPGVAFSEAGSPLLGRAYALSRFPHTLSPLRLLLSSRKGDTSESSGVWEAVLILFGQ